MDRFRELLLDLGDLIGIDLLPDRRGACKLFMDEKCYVQIEYQPQKERLLLACMIAEIPPGKFRETVLKDGLKANWPSPNCGTLCYSDKNNKLCLFEFVPLEYLNADKFFSILNRFTEKALSWQSGVEKGQTGSLVSKKF